MSWSSLPEELWKLILSYVPQHECLGSCSRVTQKLCRAAAAATEQLVLGLNGNVQRSEGFKLWLRHRGQHVSSLELLDVAGDLTELPCPQLHTLDLNTSRVQLGPSDGQPGILRDCSRLTKLIFYDCILLDGPNSLSALSAVPALQHLELVGGHNDLSLPSDILQVLTQLTVLVLDVKIEVSAASLQHISALQHLRIEPGGDLLISPSSTPGLAQLTGVCSLTLHSLTLDPDVLQSYTRLQCFTLGRVIITGERSGATLLSVIGQQLQLQELSLSQLQCEWPTAAAAYTALTASSSLQTLSLWLDRLPAGIWQAAFQQPRQLPELLSFVISCGPYYGIPASAWSTADIRSLAASFPGLSGLQIYLQPDAQLAALSQVTTLCCMTVHRASEASVRSLSAVSQLQVLSASPAHPSAGKRCCL